MCSTICVGTPIPTYMLQMFVCMYIYIYTHTHKPTTQTDKQRDHDNRVAVRSIKTHNKIRSFDTTKVDNKSQSRRCSSRRRSSRRSGRRKSSCSGGRNSSDSTNGTCYSTVVAVLVVVVVMCSHAEQTRHQSCQSLSAQASEVGARQLSGPSEHQLLPT